MPLAFSLLLSIAWWFLLLPVSLVVATPFILIFSLFGQDSYRERLRRRYKNVVKILEGLGVGESALMESIPTKTSFRTLVIATLVLDLTAGLIDALSPSLTPQTLRQAYEETQTLADIVPWFSGGTAVIIAIIELVASIGLLVFWKPARWLYVVMFLASCLWISIFGPQLSSGPSEAVLLLSEFTVGIVVTLSYTHPIKSYFDSTSGRRVSGNSTAFLHFSKRRTD